MAEKENYVIRVEGNVVEVSPEVYYAYFHMERQERGQEEKKRRNAVLSYDALDNENLTGLESIPDPTLPSLEEQVITKEIQVWLNRAVAALPKVERDLIRAIYYDGMTEKDYAVLTGFSQQRVSYRLRKTLSKLKTLLNFMGSF